MKFDIKNMFKSLFSGNDKSPEREAKSFTLQAKTLKDIKMACIMDRFSHDCFAPECSLLQITPDNWKKEMEDFGPDLFFIESAWNGKDNLWENKISYAKHELQEVVNYCRAKGIPVVFWTKEDPYHYERFLNAAQMADVVFTTEMDCIQKYKTFLKHDRVYLLHFAAQPYTHNPIEKYERKDRFCFAGSYYHKFPDRCKLFDEFAEVFDKEKGFDIYDRNFGKETPANEFPQQHKKNILGTLDPSEIDKAYKGYNYGVNMNSITQAQTMFARRVFELFASNTIVVGNYSRGVANLFGDLTISTDDAEELRLRLRAHCSDEETMKKFRLLCLRRVLGEHLYEDRLSYLVEKVYGICLLPEAPAVELLGFAEDAQAAERLIAAYKRQTYKNGHLTLVTKEEVSEEGVTVVDPDAALDNVCTKEWIAVLSAQDYYGEHYLEDLMLSRRYTTADAFGKCAYYTAKDDTFLLIDKDQRYKKVEALALKRAVVRRELIKAASLEELPTMTVTAGELFAADEFGYCENWQEASCEAADDLTLQDTGMHIADLQAAAERVKAEEEQFITLDLRAFTNALINKESRIQYEYEGGDLIVNSALSEEESYFLWNPNKLQIKEIAEDGVIHMVYMGQGTDYLRGYITVYDKKDKRLVTTHAKMNRKLTLEVPEGAAYAKLSLKVMGPGRFTLNNIMIGAESGKMTADFQSRSNVLVLSDWYPSVENPYQRMFVHKRVSEYKKSGVLCDVFCARPEIQIKYRGYMGINILEGTFELLDSVLEHSRIDTVCVHFLNRGMWEVLKKHKDHLKIIVWSHGSDIQPWWRRKFNYKEEDLPKWKAWSEERMALWNEVFATLPNDHLQLVFVSRYAVGENMEDYGITIDANSYQVIHNVIDTDEFVYIPKDAEQRKKILTIKSFSGKNYANDLTAKAILELSAMPEFEDLEFDIYGRGDLFEAETECLKGFSNVHLHETFLSHEEIAALHKTHGIYIASTRCDTQGVSRDEAMSSGLVPIANAVTAIPEFVDDTCGILIPAEDYHGITEGILRLYRDPELFTQMSAAAAARVRRQTSRAYTIEKELELITGENR